MHQPCIQVSNSSKCNFSFIAAGKQCHLAAIRVISRRAAHVRLLVIATPPPLSIPSRCPLLRFNSNQVKCQERHENKRFTLESLFVTQNRSWCLRELTKDKPSTGLTESVPPPPLALRLRMPRGGSWRPSGIATGVLVR